jgi:hypothetical protein
MPTSNPDSGSDTIEELIANTWLDEMYHWYYCKNDYRPPGYWEAKRRCDSDAPLAQLDDESVRLNAKASAEAVREFNTLVRKRCAAAVLDVVIKFGYALRSNVIEECAVAVEQDTTAEQRAGTHYSGLLRALIDIRRSSK